MLASILYLFCYASFFLTMSCAIPISTLSSIVDAGFNDSLSPYSRPLAMPPSASRVLRSNEHDLTSESQYNQRDIVAPFPPYAVALLVIFILVSGISSVVLIVLFHSKAGRARMDGLAKRIQAPSTKFSSQGEENREEDGFQRRESVFDITQITNAPSVPTHNSDLFKNDSKNGESTAPPSLEKEDMSLTLSTGDIRGDLSGKEVVAIYKTPPDSSQGSPDAPQLSLSPEPLQALVSASASALRRLSEIISSPDNLFDVPFSDDISSAQSENFSNIVARSPEAKHSDYLGNLQDPSSSNDSLYSRVLDALSPSTAVYSLVDLATFVTVQEPTDMSTMPESFGVLEERDITDGVALRYVPGVQLETIQEESESVSSASQSTLSRHNSIIPSSSNTQFRGITGDCYVSTLSIQPFNLDHRTALPRHEVNLNESTGLPHPNGASLMNSIPSTDEELGVDQHNLIPRPLSPAVPLSPESSSMAARVYTLDRPHRAARHRSVAWLSPIFEWDMDGTREILDEDEIEDEDSECEDALHAADAMAVVMDSLAAMGLDPASMGLMAEDVPSPSLSSGPFKDSPLLSDTLISSGNFQLPKATVEDSVESQVGKVSVTGITPVRSTPKEAAPLIRETGQDSEKEAVDVPRPSESSRASSSQAQTTSDKPGNGLVQTRAPTTLEGTPRNENSAWDSATSGILVEKNSKSSGKKTRSSINDQSLTNIQAFRTPRGVRPDRVYPSPSSLAGLSPAEVSKRFSAESTSSTRSTPEKSLPPSPQYHFPSSSPSMQVRKAKGSSFSPTLRSTPCTRTSSPQNRSEPSSPRDESPLFNRQQLSKSPSTPRASASPRRSTNTRPLSPRRNLHQSHSSPIFLSQCSKHPVVPQLTRSSILQEKSNSMDFV